VFARKERHLRNAETPSFRALDRYAAPNANFVLVADPHDGLCAQSAPRDRKPAEGVHRDFKGSALGWLANPLELRRVVRHERNRQRASMRGDEQIVGADQAASLPQVGGRCQVTRAIRRQGAEQARVTETGVATETSRCDSERRRLRDDVPFPPALTHHRAIVGR
jgi:hypothetical protein